jgi:hypothetical protein
MSNGTPRRYRPASGAHDAIRRCHSPHRAPTAGRRGAAASRRLPRRAARRLARRAAVAAGGAMLVVAVLSLCHAPLRRR